MKGFVFWLLKAFHISRIGVCSCNNFSRTFNAEIQWQFSIGNKATVCVNNFSSNITEVVSAGMYKIAVCSEPNTAVGLYSLYSNTAGYSNTAIGSGSLYSNTSGFNNTAIGINSLFSNSVGNNNTAIGYAALYSNTGGIWNTVIGERALYENYGVQAHYNTAIGGLALA
jgi:hypothetical protein